MPYHLNTSHQYIATLPARRAPPGVDGLIAAKARDLQQLLVGTMTEERIRLREEVQEQIRALKELKEMAAAYGEVDRGWVAGDAGLHARLEHPEPPCMGVGSGWASCRAV